MTELKSAVRRVEPALTNIARVEGTEDAVLEMHYGQQCCSMIVNQV